MSLAIISFSVLHLLVLSDFNGLSLGNILFTSGLVFFHDSVLAIDLFGFATLLSLSFIHSDGLDLLRVHLLGFLFLFLGLSLLFSVILSGAVDLGLLLLLGSLFLSHFFNILLLSFSLIFFLLLFWGISVLSCIFLLLLICFLDSLVFNLILILVSDSLSLGLGLNLRVFGFGSNFLLFILLSRGLRRGILYW